MLRNHLIIIWRTIYRQPTYAILNLLGLVVGIAATLFILLYIDFELNYDRFHAKADRIFRVETKAIKTKDKVIDVDWQGTPANFAALAKQDYPEIEQCVRFFGFHQGESIRFQYQEQEFAEEEVAVTDANVFNVFSFDLIRGNPQNALKGPNKVVLSESFAKRIFGEENPIGKTLKSKLVHNVTSTEADYAFTVTGIYKDTPQNTHLLIQALISAESDPELNNYYFNRFGAFTYILLKETIDPIVFAPKLTQIYENYLDPKQEPVMVSAQHELMPLTNIHLEATGGLTYIYIFGAVSLLMLLIAGISYVNMVTAQASRRALEIGIRKVLGSGRRSLVFQFLSESLFFTTIAILLSLLIVKVSIQPINELLNLRLIADQLWQPQLLFGMLLIILLLGLLGGSYPAFFLSSFQPISVLKGKLVKGAPIRKVLVAIQFAVVIFVLTCTGMIYNQLQFLKKKNLGFDQEQIIQLALSGTEAQEKAPVLQEALLKNPNIEKTTTCSFTPGLGGMTRRPISAEGKTGQEPQFTYLGYVDYDYFSTMNIEMISGRNFSPDFPGDQQNSVIINEAMVQKFGLQEPIIGEKIRWGDKNNPNYFTIIGLVKDFHQSSLHSPIESQIFHFRPASAQLTIKIGEDIPAGIAHIEQSWAALFPDLPFDFRFLDEALQSYYEADQRRGQIFLSFSMLTIFIAFLGLFGLASYQAKQRTKEIGIRKVFGASISDMILLMTKNFLILILIVALPAFVGAWYVIKQWLANFAFQSEMNYWLFALVLLFTLLLTFLTTGFHALRAAQLNPARTLKHE